MQRAAGRHDVRRETVVVFDVTREHHRLILLAFEFGEQVFRHLAERIDEHVEAPAVCHADHELLHAGRAPVLQQLVEHRNQAIAALQRKSRLADVLGMQIAFQRLCRRQTLEDVLAVRRVVGGRRARRFQAFLDPAFLRHIAHVHVFGADGAAIGVLQQLHDILQLHLARPDQRTGAEHGFHIGVAQAVKRELQFGHYRLFVPPQGIDIGDARALEAIRAYELQNTVLFFAKLRLAARRGGNARNARAFGKLREIFLHWCVRDVARAIVEFLQLVEVGAPARLDRGRILEIALVERLDKRRVGAEQVRIAAQFAIGHDARWSPARAYLRCAIGTNSRLPCPV